MKLLPNGLERSVRQWERVSATVRSQRGFDMGDSPLNVITWGIKRYTQNETYSKKL